MLERSANGDLMAYWTGADAYVVTTNTTVKQDGTNPMGVGIARQAALRHPRLPAKYGAWLQLHEEDVLLRRTAKEHVLAVELDGESLLLMPTKREVYRASPVDLVVKSLAQLVQLVNWTDWSTVHMPRPGCGAGMLQWDDIKPVCELLLDDRFTVWSY